jgi:enamine deaminase RidA (YjgF/YER057c/UK114 family)
MQPCPHGAGSSVTGANLESLCQDKGMAHLKINPDNVLQIPGLTQVMVTTGSRHVHISGQTPTDAEGKLLHEGDLQQQIVVTYRNLLQCLEAAGATIDDVVKLGIYIVDYDEQSIGALMGAIADVFGDAVPSPTSTLIGVQALFMPGQRVEIDAIAVLE